MKYETGKDMGVELGGEEKCWGYRELCHIIERAVPSCKVATSHMRLN